MTHGGNVPHIIRPNKRNSGPQAWVTFAINTTETQLGERRVRHDFKEAAVSYWRPERRSKCEVLDFWTVSTAQELYRSIARRIGAKERCGVLADHMDFAAQASDLHACLRALRFRPTRIIIEAGRWQQRWRSVNENGSDGTRSILLLDLRNFIPAPLRSIATWLSLPFPSTAGSDASWLLTADGCKWSCMVTLRALQHWTDFRTRYDLGYFSATLAGQAFAAYRHRFMSVPIYVHCHKDVQAIEGDAHYGSRVEIFYKGRAPKDDYVQVDAKSFYGAVMRGNQFPVRQVGHTRSVGLRYFADLVEQYAVVARVEINCEEPRYPKRKGSSVIYPVGRFTTTLASPEIKDALARGEIARVEEVVTYAQAPIFDEYVDFFFGLRVRAERVGDKITAELAKRFLTAIWGKFGQRIWLSSLVRTDAVGEDRIWREFDWQDNVDYEYRIIAGRMERSIREMLGRDSFLAIPAHVTSYGRQRLWQLMEKAGRDSVYYVDTDSLIGRHVILNRLGDEFRGHALGSLRLCKTSSHLFIRAPKWYILGDTVRRAGVPNAAFEVSWNLFEGDEQRSMRWRLLHHGGPGALVERVQIQGPLKERLSTRGLGERVEPFRYGPEPTRPAPHLTVPTLPLGPLPE